jgi:hypothetical protein
LIGEEGEVMTTALTLVRAAAVLCCAFQSMSFAAAPDDIAVEAPAAPEVAAPVGLDYALETEMVVHNWVLCISAPLAEQLARARATSLDEARSAYADLAGAKSCGQFPELRVILRERLYSSASGSEHDTRVFGALVNLSGSWANAFVVSGSLPED